MPSARAEVVAGHLLLFPVSSCILSAVLWFVRNLVELARRQHGQCRMRCGDPDPRARCSIRFLPWVDVTCVVCKPWPTLVPVTRVHKWEKNDRKGSVVLQRDLGSLRSWFCSNKMCSTVLKWEIVHLGAKSWGFDSWMAPVSHKTYLGRDLELRGDKSVNVILDAWAMQGWDQLWSTACPLPAGAFKRMLKDWRAQKAWELL